MSAFADLISSVLNGSMHPIKYFVSVPPKYRRDAGGRFSGGLARKGYTRVVRDRKTLKPVRELIAENVTSNNALLSRLLAKGTVR